MLVYMLAYYLANLEAYLYHHGVKRKLNFQDRYQIPKEVLDAGSAQAWVRWRVKNWTFWGALLVLAIGIPSVWQVTLNYNRTDVFLILVGGLILAEFAELVGNLRNILWFRRIRETGAVKGQAEFSKKATLSLVYGDQYSFAALYFFLFLVTSSWFLLGGALTCAISGRRGRDWVVVKT